MDKGEGVRYSNSGKEFGIGSCGKDSSSKRFRFDKATDIALLNAVVSEEAHIAKNGAVKDNFIEALNVFCLSHEVKSKTSEGVPAPKLSTMQDRFSKLLTDRRAENSRNVSASGVAEHHGELEQTLDEIISEVDDKKRTEQEKKDEVENRESQLKEPAEKVREMATNTNPRKLRRTNQPVALSRDDADFKELLENDKRRLELEERRIALAEATFKRDCEEREAQAEEPIKQGAA